MERTTSSEFVEWMGYLDEEEIKGFDRRDFYLAQIACEVRRSFTKHPQRVKLRDFLLQFGERKTQRSTPEVSKLFWFSALGITKEHRHDR